MLVMNTTRLKAWIATWSIQTTRQRLGVRWQRCKAQACIGDTAFAGWRSFFGHSLPSGLQKRCGAALPTALQDAVALLFTLSPNAFKTQMSLRFH